MTNGHDLAWASDPRVVLPPKGFSRRRRTPVLITIGRWLLVLFLLGICIPFAILAGSHR